MTASPVPRVLALLLVCGSLQACAGRPVAEKWVRVTGAEFEAWYCADAFMGPDVDGAKLRGEGGGPGPVLEIPLTDLRSARSELPIAAIKALRDLAQQRDARLEQFVDPAAFWVRSDGQRLGPVWFIFRSSPPIDEGTQTMEAAMREVRGLREGMSDDEVFQALGVDHYVADKTQYMPGLMVTQDFVMVQYVFRAAPKYHMLVSTLRGIVVGVSIEGPNGRVYWSDH